MTPFEIDGRVIGPGHPTYIVAELSGNHNGDIRRAFAIMDAAKRAGADAVKIQTYTADTITIDCDRPDFRIEGGAWHGRRLHELYREAHTPWHWHADLFAHARSICITMFSTPFDATAVDFLETLGAPAYKIASFEAVDLPLIRRVATTGKPVIVSTGIADLGEIAEAVQAARGAACRSLGLLHCVSAYPASPDDMNLRTIPHLMQTFDVMSGLSDHTLDSAVAVAAVALGACIIEKHLTLARHDGGPDSSFSLEPSEFTALVASCRTAEAALGRVTYARQSGEERNAMFRRSLYAVVDIGAGEPCSARNVRSIRPGYGLAPKHVERVMGMKARRPIPRGTALSWDLLE